MNGKQVLTATLVGVVLTVSAVISYSNYYSSNSSIIYSDADNLQDLIQKRAIPIRHDRDLKSLAKKIPHVSALLLGESTHGTKEFYESRAILTKQLIEDGRVKFVSVEGSWNVIYQLNRFVLGLDDQEKTAEDLLRQHAFWPHWMWANQEFADFINWLHLYNKRRNLDERIAIYGLDIYDSPLVMARLQEFIGEHTNLQSELFEAFACLPKYGESIWNYASAIASGAEDCKEEMELIRTTLKEKLPQIIPNQRQLIFYKTEMAEVLVSAELYYRTVYQGGADSWNARARHMASQFLRLIDFYERRSGLGIYWAHNTHIGDARATSTGLQGFDNIGMIARQHLGVEQVYLLGQSSTSGGVLAGTAFNQPSQVFQMPAPKEESFDKMLHEHRLARFFVPFHRDDVLNRNLAQATPQRAIGIVYNPEDETHNYVPSVVPMRYDGLLFFRETSPLTPLEL